MRYSFLLLILLMLQLPVFAVARTVIVNNFNQYSVASAPTKPSRIEVKQQCTVTSLKTYHFNQGRGRQPGIISLKRENGSSVGMWNAALEAVQAKGSAIPVNAMWVCRPGIALNPGIYLIEDSDPSTWSCNKESGMRGFYSITLQPGALAGANEIWQDPAPAGKSTEVKYGGAQQKSQAAGLIYRRYVNPRFKYGIDYPDFLVAGEESDNADGCKFSSKDDEAELIVYGQSVYGTVDGTAWTLSSLRDEALAHRKQDGDRVTYQNRGPTWCVLSGLSGDQIFYFKMMIDDEKVKAFEFRYPARKKNFYDPIVVRIVRSFKNTL
ncbi:MAG: hypothetical protein K2W95_08260 [Candidatus Obscuribacterales bacterium]|nr:hypothetical protein [Candidatus Obscuribacterales bacterium]